MPRTPAPSSRSCLPPCLPLAAACLLGLTARVGGAADAAYPVLGETARALAVELTRSHVLHLPLDDAMAARAFDSLLANIDGDRIYLLAEDVEKLAARRNRLDDDLAAGDLSFAAEVLGVWRRRALDRCDYVERLLAEGVEPKAADAPPPRRAAAAWPHDEAEWNEIWRSRVANELAARMARGRADRGRDADPARPVADRMAKACDRFRTVVEELDAGLVAGLLLTSFCRAYDPHTSVSLPPDAETGDPPADLAAVLAAPYGSVEANEAAPDFGPVRMEMVESGGAAGAGMKLAVVRIPVFREATAPELARTLAEAEKAGARGLVLDLRGNAGGSFPEGVNVAGLFLAGGPVLQVRTGPRNILVVQDEDPAVAFSGQLVVLVDRRSASAAEAVAGILQDYGRAMVVGDSRTHGKATMQMPKPLGEHGRFGVLTVSTAQLHRLGGDTMQRRGMRPDIVVPSPLDAGPETGEDSMPNALDWPGRPPAVEIRRWSDLGPAIGPLARRSAERRDATRAGAAAEPTGGRDAVRDEAVAILADLIDLAPPRRP